eukprot:748036-Hanusia_phi.AAC.1
MKPADAARRAQSHCSSGGIISTKHAKNASLKSTAVVRATKITLLQTSASSWRSDRSGRESRARRARVQLGCRPQKFILPHASTAISPQLRTTRSRHKSQRSRGLVTL